MDRRDQVFGGGSARRPEMAGLPDALRPAILCLHAGPAVRDFPRRYRPDHLGCLWRPSALLGSITSLGSADPHADDVAVRHGLCATDQPAASSAGSRVVLIS